MSLGEQARRDYSSPAEWKLDSRGLRLGIGILVVGQSMIFGLALNLHDDVPVLVRQFVEALLLAATLLVVVLLGGPLLQAAVRELRQGRLTLEALFLLTMGGAMAASLQAHLTGHGTVYFEVVSILLVVYTIGQWIAARSRTAALAETRAWERSLQTCRIVDGIGSVRVAAVTEVVPGNLIEVHPGELIAVDGVIREGTGLLAEAPVNGEPFAVSRGPGDSVLAGVMSYDAMLRVEATASGRERQIDQLLAAVQHARDTPLSLQHQADRLARIFFPLVGLTAIGTFGYWTWVARAGWETGLFNAMSVLLVSCPCVIGIATPIVIWTALSRLAERGLIARSSDIVERLATATRVVFDKTGTLTEDRYAIVDIVMRDSVFRRDTLLSWLSLIQSHSPHPIARPFTDLPRSFTPDTMPHIASFRNLPGRGVEAELNEADGNSHLVRLESIACGSGDHAITVIVDGECVADVILRERLRHVVPETIADLEALGLHVEVVTGDREDRAANLRLPNPRGGLLPNEKRDYVQSLMRSGERPLMVGDGVNDAAALATAHVGIALASGTDLAVTAADATLYHGDLRAIPWAIQLSRTAMRVVRGSLLRAVGYNIVGISLASCGWLHPVAAVCLMVVSSVTLMFSATRFDARSIQCAVIPSSDTTRVRRQAIVHSAAIMLQGLLLIALIGPMTLWPGAVLFLGGFTVAAIVGGYLWRCWESVPHTLDMVFGMLTLGNLGMLLGWWIDNGFASVHCVECCSCRDPITRPGMWLGMLVFANIAMIRLERKPPHRSGHHVPAMYTGGNVGMLLGMWGGGVAASAVPVHSSGGLVVVHFVGMTLGMVGGMLLGTWLIERLIGMVIWLSRGSTVLPDEIKRGQPEANDNHRVANILGR